MKSFEKGWKIELLNLTIFMNNFDSEIVHVLILFTFHIWKTIVKLFAALFIQLWNFRVFLFLKFFAKSINKVTRRDYVNWGTIVEINTNTELPNVTVPYRTVVDPVL